MAGEKWREKLETVADVIAAEVSQRVSFTARFFMREWPDLFADEELARSVVWKAFTDAIEEQAKAELKLED